MIKKIYTIDGDKIKLEFNKSSCYGTNNCSLSICNTTNKEWNEKYIVEREQVLFYILNNFCKF